MKNLVENHSDGEFSPDRRNFLVQAVSVVLSATGLQACGVAGQERRIKHTPTFDVVDRPGRTDWREMQDLNAISSAIRSGNRVAVLVGASWCHNCPWAADFWRSQNIGPFNPYYLHPGDDAWQEIYASGDPYVVPAIRANRALPILIFFDRGRMIQSFSGGLEATKFASEWLTENGIE